MEIKKMSMDELNHACETIRHEVIEAVSACGGHLGSNLGIVELTMALHYTLNSPKDVILFDVGHQSYVHKILTGRRERMKTIRTFGGLSPFLDTNESEHDFYTTGHAGNIISAAAGIAIANPERRVVAVIGDASLSNGQALEAINSINGKIGNLFIVVNDNEMSIGKNVGGIFKYLNGLMYNRSYSHLKKNTKKMLDQSVLGSKITHFAGRMENSVKSIISPGNLFLELGYQFVGPLEGHNLSTLIRIFNDIFEEKHEQTHILHVKTIKGKGYPFAEQEQEKFHGVAPFNIEDGEPLSGKSESFSEIFGKTMVTLGKEHTNLYAISAAMIKGVGLSSFFEQFPTRSIDVGIAEMHAVTLAGGLAVGGKRPVVAIYSTFMQRAYDQLIHDISIQKLPLILVMDRAGLVGEDGKTHHGIFDISFIRTVPYFKIFAPSCANEIPMILEHTVKNETGPVAIRISKSNAYFEPRITEFVPGKWNVISQGEKLLILATGTTLIEVLKIEKKLNERGVFPTIVGVSSIKPLDETFLLRECALYERVITIEENVKSGGFGSLLLEFLNDHQALRPIEMISFEDCYIPHGSRSKLLEAYDFSGDGLVERICKE